MKLKLLLRLALSLAEKNKKEIDGIKSNVGFVEFTCDRLVNENKMLKKRTINLDNYSRRNNVVIRGISENSSESNVECEVKTRKFMINELKLDDGSKRHSLQAVELSQQTQAGVQIVSNLPAPSNGGPIYRFLGMPAMRTRWMAGAAAHKSG